MDSPRGIQLSLPENEQHPTLLQKGPTYLSTDLPGDTPCEIKIPEFCQILTFTSRTKLRPSDQFSTLALMGQMV